MTTTYTKQELTDLLTNAQQQMRDALDNLRQYAKATKDRNAEAYLIDHLAIMTEREHGFLSRDLNVDDLLDRLPQHFGAEVADLDKWWDNHLGRDSHTDRNGEIVLDLLVDDIAEELGLETDEFGDTYLGESGLGYMVEMRLQNDGIAYV